MLLEKGSTGYNVLILQNALTALNYSVGKIDGVYGDKTVEGVKAYQNDHDLACDGITGNLTWESILNSVKGLQKLLNKYGAKIIEDGIVGVNTKNAIISFQIANNLSADGIVGADTRKALNKDDGACIDSSSGAYGISDNLINFVACYESYYAEPYRGLDSQNRTIGYGHVILDNEDYSYLTQEQAIKLLNDDLQIYVREVNELVKDIELSQNQFDALVSFGYNCGCGVNGLKTSTLLKDIKRHADSETIRTDFMMWCMCNGKKSLGLYRRRNDEANMYLNGTYEKTYINF